MCERSVNPVLRAVEHAGKPLDPSILLTDLIFDSLGDTARIVSGFISSFFTL